MAGNPIKLSAYEDPAVREAAPALEPIGYTGQSPAPAQAHLPTDLVGQAEERGALGGSFGHERGLRSQPLGQQQDLRPAAARGLVLVHRDRRARLPGPLRHVGVAGEAAVGVAFTATSVPWPIASAVSPV